MFLSDTDMVIMYLSSGITSRDASEHEKRETLRVVKEENRHLNNSVMILTYALMNGKGTLHQHKVGLGSKSPSGPTRSSTVRNHIEIRSVERKELF